MPPSSDSMEPYEVSDLLEDAAQRAEDNDRKTVQARDL